MNQILNTNFNSQDNDDEKEFKNKNKKIFNTQFIISILAIIIFISFFFYYKHSLVQKENFSNLLINNYNISKLYSDNTDTNNENNISDDTIIGLIKIPKLNISYTFFSGLNDDLLKVSPCRFYGEMPNNGINKSDNNLCIAGHNYDNEKFFSNIKKLDDNDEIIISDNNNNEYIYKVFKNYEVDNNDLSPIYYKMSDEKSSELTLVTCNNFNNKRIIIKAKNEGV